MKKPKYLVVIKSSEDGRPVTYYVASSGGFTLDRKEAQVFKEPQAHRVAHRFQGKLELAK